VTTLPFEEDGQTVGGYLLKHGYSREFMNDYLVPMAAAIWSAEPVAIQEMPLQFLVRFFDNHGLLQLKDRPVWRVIRGGSREYVGKMVEGHADRLVVGRLGGQETLVMQGRAHYYEGYSLQEVTFPIRILKGIGAEILIVTNAAGGLNTLFHPGDLMIIVDHINLMPENPLRGIHSESLGDRFQDLSEAYDRELIKMAREMALELGIHLREGVYVGIPGPSLETASETRLLRTFGADAVGMSTVPEVIVARSVGLRVVGLSVISNVNRPDAFQPILLDEIIANTKAAEPKLIHLIKGIVSAIESEGSP